MGDWKVITSPLGMRDVVVFDDGGWIKKITFRIVIYYSTYNNLFIFLA